MPAQLLAQTGTFELTLQLAMAARGIAVLAYHAVDEMNVLFTALHPRGGSFSRIMQLRTHEDARLLAGGPVPYLVLARPGGLRVRAARSLRQSNRGPSLRADPDQTPWG